MTVHWAGVRAAGADRREFSFGSRRNAAPNTGQHVSQWGHGHGVGFGHRVDRCRRRVFFGHVDGRESATVAPRWVIVQSTSRIGRLPCGRRRRRMTFPELDGSQPCAQIDPDLWFPEGGMTGGAKHAIAICKTCEFELPCLIYALHNNVEGIWGGTTYQQRKMIRKKRGIVAKPIVWILSDSPDAVKARQRRAKLKEQKGETT